MLSRIDPSVPVLRSAINDAAKLNCGETLFGKRHALNILATDIMNYTGAAFVQSQTTLNLGEVNNDRGLFNVSMSIALNPVLYNKLLGFVDKKLRESVFLNNPSVPFMDIFAEIDKYVTVDKMTGIITLALDSFLVTYKRIPNAPYLFSEEEAIACQMYDLLEFAKVPQQRRLARDFSYLVPENYSREEIMQDAICQLGKDARYLDELKILSVTNFEDLTESAVRHLNAKPKQKNVLLHLAIRPSETKTLFNQDYWQNFAKAINICQGE